MKLLLSTLLIFCFPISAQQIYDLLIRNGRVVDPANHRNGQADIAVIGNRIARVAQSLPAAHARVVVDAAGYFVTPGLIDIETHFGSGVQPDYNSLPYGVTTAVDDGSANCETFSDFKKQVIDHAKVRVLEFLSATDPECTLRAVRQNPETIVGIAATPATVQAALNAASASKTVLMMGNDSQSSEPGAAVLKQFRPGDIATRVYSRVTPALDSTGRVRPAAEEARRRGILFNSAHGSDGLWYRIAQPAVAAKFLPDTISSGMDRNSMVLPRANLSTVMSLFLNLGITEEQVIERVTSNAAHALKRPPLGNLSEGGIADIAVLEVQRGNFGFLDSGHARLQGTRRFSCVLTVRNGIIVWDSKGLSIPDTLRAGPYTNFK